jgi:predicted DNA-binding helix-hairpin-helix protein
MRMMILMMMRVRKRVRMRGMWKWGILLHRAHQLIVDEGDNGRGGKGNDADLID